MLDPQGEAPGEEEGAWSESWVNRNFTATTLIFAGYGACAELEEEENEGSCDCDL